jgi:hypothetical protein
MKGSYVIGDVPSRVYFGSQSLLFCFQSAWWEQPPLPWAFTMLYSGKLPESQSNRVKGPWTKTSETMNQNKHFLLSSCLFQVFCHILESWPKHLVTWVRWAELGLELQTPVACPSCPPGTTPLPVSVTVNGEDSRCKQDLRFTKQSFYNWHQAVKF